MAMVSMRDAADKYFDMFPGYAPKDLVSGHYTGPISVRENIFGICSNNHRPQNQTLLVKDRLKLILEGPLYQLLKEDTFLRFQDRYNLITDRKSSGGSSDCAETGLSWYGFRCDAVGCGDAVWRTSLATIAISIEGDYERTLELLKALDNYGWKGGRPHRHPAENKPYPRDALMVHMAACYYAWKRTKDHLNNPTALEVYNLSKDILNRFIIYLLTHGFSLSDINYGLLPPSTIIVLSQVSREMGLTPIILSPLDLINLINPTFAIGRIMVAVKDRLKQKVKDALNEALKKPSLPKLGGGRHYLPMDFRHRIVDLVTDALFGAGDVIGYLVDLITDIPTDGLPWILNTIKDTVRDALRHLLGGFVDDLSLWFFALYIEIVAELEELGDIARLPGYWSSLVFWEILLMYETNRASLLSKFGLHLSTTRLYVVCRPRHLAPLFWITNHRTDPQNWLNHWPVDWNKVDYVWHRNLTQQTDDIRDFTGNHSFPKLDYMVLKRLMDDVPTPNIPPI